MNEVLSYPKADTPYQSCWLIVTKTLIINRICLKTVLGSLDTSASRTIPIVGMGGSLEELVSRLNVKINLPNATLEQAFISSSFQTENHGRLPTIRHCQVCIDLNYHSSLFQNPLIDRCPVHGDKLNYCKCCTAALTRKGVFFTRPLIKEQACEHLRSLMQSRVPTVKLAECDIKAFALLGEKYQEWLSGIVRLNLGSASEVIPKILDMKDPGVVEFYFEYVRSRIGLPFELSWQTNAFRHKICQVNYAPFSNTLTPAGLLESVGAGCLPQNSDAVTTVSDIIKSVKSMRRHFFRKYIRSHRKCFKNFKRLSHAQLNCLNFSNRCTCVSAYCAWLVSSGGVSTLPEYLRMKTLRSMEEIFSDLISVNSPNLRDILVSQFVSFFDVWGALEAANTTQKKYSDVVITRASIPNNSFACMNASYTLTRRDITTGKVKKEKSYIISPSQLGSQSQNRCFGSGQKRLSTLVQKDIGSVYVPRSHGIIRFVDSGGAFQETLVISIW